MCIVFFANFLNAQTLEFEILEYDFGQIKELGGAVSYRFVYSNTGDKPLIINSVHTSCGCTSPAWSKEPVLPNKSGYIDVNFDPREREGGFTKSIIVKSNAGEQTLYISGEVLPKPDPISAEYPFKMFDLRLKTSTINFNKINYSETATKEIEVFNPSKANIKIETQNTDFMTITPKPQILKPGAKGVLKCVFNPQKLSQYDMVNFSMPIFVNTYEYKLNVKAIVTEEFSKEIIANPPIMSFADSIKLVDLGVLTEGDSTFCALTFKNTGLSTLKIRAIRNASEWIKINYDKIKDGVLPNNRGYIEFNFFTQKLSGTYDRYVTIVTNSPKTQHIVVHFRLHVNKKGNND